MGNTATDPLTRTYRCRKCGQVIEVRGRSALLLDTECTRCGARAETFELSVTRDEWDKVPLL